MKYSYNWLKELSKTKKTPEKLADLLTMRAFELEEIKKEGRETQLTLDILANRGHDCLSHIGIAREICAVEGRKLHLTFNVRAPLTLNVRKLQVKIKDKNLCRRYIGAVLENIEVAPSPKWIQERLLVCGIKPINNIVDITNYVMLETGQPLHAFDASVVSEQGSIINVVVRKAKKNEKITLLDEKEYTLDENNLVIADSKKALALAGVMGGIESGITQKTNRIILESANFDPTNIRKTRTFHNISTESSYRFERNIDPNLAEAAAARAIELMQKFGGKEVKIAAYADEYAKKIKPWAVELDLGYALNLLGENISAEKIKSILTNLDLAISQKGKNLIVKIPTFRIDLKTEEDLIEEIGRIYGYENIAAKSPTVALSSPAANKEKIFEDKLRDTAAALGFSEMLNYSFYGQSDIEKCGLNVEDHLEIANPMNPDQQYLRTTLVPGILKNVELNLKNFEKFSIFEIGRIYLDPNAKTPNEKTIFAGALVKVEDKKDIFFELKGKIEELLECLGIENAEFSQPKIVGPFFHPSRTAVIKAKSKVVGYLGEINPGVLNKYKIKTRVAAFELNMKEMHGLAFSEKEYKTIGKFPSVKRDISMFVKKDTKYSEIVTKINEAERNLILGVELFDIFEKENEKSLAFRLEIGSQERTLTSSEIDMVMKKIIAKVEKDLKVKVRK